jgi:hypothetical protein
MGTIGGLPFPASSEPVRNGAANIEALARQINGQMVGGLLQGTSAADSSFTVANHGLGVVPLWVVWGNGLTGNPPVDAISTVKLNIVNNSGLQFVLQRSDGTGALAGNPYRVWWVAYGIRPPVG